MADAWGIDHSFVNSRGETEEVAPETVEALRRALGEPGPERRPLLVAAGQRADLGEGAVELESGETLDAGEAAGGGLPVGYHRLVPPEGGPRDIISSPGRCHLPQDLRTWGWAVQLYGARSRESWGMGDLADLDRLGEWSAGMGAGFTLISPIAAAAPTSRQQANPYYPASRRFRNPLYLSVENVPGAERVAGRVAEAARAGHALNRGGLVDRDRVWELKMGALEAIWASASPPEELTGWLRGQPPALRLYGIWSVIAERHGSRWQEWPPGLRHPSSGDVAALAESESDRVMFHIWLQWCLSNQLEEAGRRVSVIQDLPIGFDPGGFDAWEWQDLLALDVSVGAPPDPFNMDGQDWGTPPFVPWRLRSQGYQPFIESVRANLAAGGGLRIDHVMGLWRLWCIPHGAGPAEGAYIRFPALDLLAILAIESSRAGAVIVGEDLGTVEEGVREMLSGHDILSYRLLWFEPRPPQEWPVEAMAAVTTHDLPTVAGLWDGSDLEEQRALGLTVDEAGNEGIRRHLAQSAALAGDAGVTQAVEGAYRQLSKAPSRLLTATLEDALSARQRPNMPGVSGRRVNWRLALPVPLDEIESHPLANRVSVILDEAVAGGDGKESNA